MFSLRKFELGVSTETEPLHRFKAGKVVPVKPLPAQI
jgi:hypothetical protein